MASSCPGTSRSCNAEIETSHGCLYKNELHTQFNFACLATTFNSKMLCDVILVAEGMEVSAHKLVLACCSTPFYWKFSKDRKSVNRIEIDNITYKTLSAVIEYLYKSEIFISKDNVEELLAAADMFVLQDVQVACRKFLKEQLDSRNCLRHRDLAKRFNCVQLVPIIDNFVGINFAIVINGHEFLQLPHEQVIDLISSDALSVREEDVLECVFNWITHDMISRKDLVYTILDKIRFSLIPLQYIIERLTKEPWLKSDPRYELFLGKIFKCYFPGDAMESVPKPRQSLKPSQSSKSTSLLKPIQTSDLLVVAGINNKGYLSIEMYDSLQNIWLKWPESLDVKCDSGSKFAIVGSKMYCFTGSCLKFCNLSNPTSVKWAESCHINPFPDGCWDLACHGNRIFVVSVQNNTKTNSKCFDVDAEAWVIIPPMLLPRYYVGWGYFKDSLYAVGGFYNSQCRSDIECYKSNTNCWYSIPNMTIARMETGVASLGDKLYVVGGSNSQAASKQVEVFDYSECSWSTLPEMNHARRAPGVIALNGCLYVVGGYNNNGVINSAEVFDPQLNTWSMLTVPMTTGKKNVVFGLIDRSEVNILQLAK